MKKYLLGMAFVAFLAVGGYSQKADAAACALTGSFADLIGTACTIDDKLFGDFAISGDLVGSNVQYTVVNAGGFDGFIFQFGLTANSGQTTDFSLFYDVECTTNPGCIISAHLGITGGVTGGGSVSVAETACLDDFYSSCANGSINLFASIPGSTTANAKIDPGVTILGITKDIDASCAGLQECIATISVLTNTVDQTTPEPATVLLLGAGLAGLGLFRRRKGS